ncbi:MAG: DUF454 family protein, partial [Kiritimatiellales bacterium]
MIKTIHRGLWLTAGVFFLSAGIAGLLLPVVPQLPFFFAAIICFMRCSNWFRVRMEKRVWLIRQRTRFR